MTDVAVMTPDHPRWAEFTALLEGPEGCDFREEGDPPKATWTCFSDHTLTTKVLKSMGFDEDFINASIAWFVPEGGHCACEILFNVGPVDVASTAVPPDG